MKNIMLANILSTVFFNAVAQNRARCSVIADSASGQRIAQLIVVSRFDFAPTFDVAPSQPSFSATGAVVALASPNFHL